MPIEKTTQTPKPTSSYLFLGQVAIDDFTGEERSAGILYIDSSCRRASFRRQEVQEPAKESPPLDLRHTRFIIYTE